MSRSNEPLSISRLAESITVPWDARDLVTANDSVFRVLRAEGMMEWHHHEEDQLFLCWSGTFTIEQRGLAAVRLGPGDIFVIPRGVEHTTSADAPAYVLMSIGVHTPARL